MLLNSRLRRHRRDFERAALRSREFLVKSNGGRSDGIKVNTPFYTLDADLPEAAADAGSVTARRFWLLSCRHMSDRERCTRERARDSMEFKRGETALSRSLVPSFRSFFLPLRTYVYVLDDRARTRTFGDVAKSRRCRRAWRRKEALKRQTKVRAADVSVGEERVKVDDGDHVVNILARRVSRSEVHPKTAHINFREYLDVRQCDRNFTIFLITLAK